VVFPLRPPARTGVEAAEAAAEVVDPGLRQAGAFAQSDDGAAKPDLEALLQRQLPVDASR